MRKNWITACLLIWTIAFPVFASGQDDLFQKKKSDSAIKPLVFPLSMTVIESRPAKGQYYFYEGDSARFDEGLEGTPDSADNKFYNVLSDPKLIKKTLVATDLARITPSKRGDDIRGPVTKTRLKEMAKKFSTDMVLVFRRKIRLFTPPHLPPSFFLLPGNYLTQPWKETYSVNIQTQGLIYLTKQNKVMVIPSNEKSKSFISKGKQSARENLLANWQELTKEGLKDLTASAKKTILDKQFVVRRPTY